MRFRKQAPKDGTLSGEAPRYAGRRFLFSVKLRLLSAPFIMVAVYYALFFSKFLASPRDWFLDLIITDSSLDELIKGAVVILAAYAVPLLVVCAVFGINVFRVFRRK